MFGMTRAAELHAAAVAVINVILHRHWQVEKFDGIEQRQLSVSELRSGARSTACAII